MGLILDTCLLIAHERETFDLAGFLATWDEPVALSSITASELLHGCHRAANPQQRNKRMRYVEWVLAEFDTVPFALGEARHHARLWSDLASQGKMIGSHDLLIAATAISLGFGVATLNHDEFSLVSGLPLIDKNILQQFAKEIS